MSLISQNSQQTPLCEFDSFAVPMTQTTVREDVVTEHRPLALLDHKHPIEFQVTCPVDEYVHLRETILFFRLHLVGKKSGGTLETADFAKVRNVENMLHSMFESVELTIGDRQVTTCHSTYAYRSMYELLFNTGTAAKTTFISGARVQSAPFEGLDEKRSKTIELAARLNLDLTFQEKAIIGGCTINIKLYPHKPEFYLLCDEADLSFVPVFESASLEVHRSKVFDSIVHAHEAALKVTPAKYPINRIEVRNYTIAKDSMDAYIDNALNGQLPRRVYIAMVANAAFHGDLAADPMKFEHFNIDHLVTYYNGKPFPAKPYSPDFTNKKYLREYMALFEASNQMFSDTKCIISPDDFASSKTFFGINYCPDLADDCHKAGHVSLQNRGTLRIEMHFKEKLPKAVSLLMFTEFDNIIEITSERNGLVDYS